MLCSPSRPGSDSSPNCGWRGECGKRRTSTRYSTPFVDSRLVNCSKDLVECPMVRINGVSSGWPSVIGPSTVASFERIPDKPFFPTSLTYCEQAERALDACATTVRSRHERRTPAQVALRVGHRTGTLAFRDGLRKGRDPAQGGRRGLLE